MAEAGRKIAHKRINVRVSPEVYDEVKRWSRELGLTMSQLGGMSVYSGLRYIVRAIDPIKSIDDADLARLIALMEDGKPE